MRRFGFMGLLGIFCTMRLFAGELQVGVDANYSLGMEREDVSWIWPDGQADLFGGMAERGITGFRVRLWVGEEGDNQKAYATEVVKRALAAGLDPYLVIFLSEDWADMMKQPLPEAWKGLSFEERLEAIRVYSRDIVAHFRSLGLTNHLVEVGNEIDYGIAGEYPSKSAKKTPGALSRRLWPRSAEIIRACQEGVLESDPDAGFMLHISHWWDLPFCTAFFQFMLDAGVRVDFAGLSYFPTANIGGSLEMDEFFRVVDELHVAIGRPILVPEVAYPSTREFKGQFSRWKYPAIGYPLTPDGQRRWVLDFLARCAANPAIPVIYYWSPEWCGEGMWKAFALFEPDGAAKPAWESFTGEAWKNHIPMQDYLVLDLHNNRLFVVPVEEAKTKMKETVFALREQTGGVNVGHIALLDETEAFAGAYRIRLKSSLQHNMLLDFQPGANGIALDDEEGIRNLLKEASPKTQTLILVIRKSAQAQAAGIQALLEERGFRVYPHPMADDDSIRFGMNGVFTGSSASAMY